MFHSATAIVDDTSSSPARAPPAAAVPSPTKVPIDEPIFEEDPTKSPEPVASSAHSPAQSEPAQAEHSPGQGSGTKKGEVEAARTSVEGAADTLATVTPSRARSPPPVHNTDQAPSARLPALESMSMSELRKEYFIRLSQHKELEGHLVQLMQRHHEVITQIVHAFLSVCPYTL